MKFNKKDTGIVEKPELYTDEELAALEGHIAEHFGEYQGVFHERHSPDIHLDVAIIDPTPERDFYTLVTMGMGAHRMDVPPEGEGLKLERAELMVCLPPDWEIDSEEGRWSWPLMWLKRLGRMPVEYPTWLGWGHTVPTVEDVSEDAAFRCMMLLYPVAYGAEAAVCQLPDGDEVNIYQMVPIYEGEMMYKQENGIDDLLELMDYDDVAVVDVRRESVCEEGAPAEDLPLSERARLFWEWFSENEAELSAMVESREDYGAEAIVSLVDKGVSLISPDLYFSMGGDHEFNFSVNGDWSLFYILPYLISRMPEEHRGKWSFSPYMPGTGGDSLCIEMFGVKVTTDDVMVSLRENEEGRLDVRFHGGALAGLEDGDRRAAFGTLVVNTAGELLPYMLLGDAEYIEEPEGGMFPLNGLRGRLEALAPGAAGPSERFEEYDVDPDGSGGLRSDVSKVVTCYPGLVGDYFEGSFQSFEAAAGHGAWPVFIFFAAEGGGEEGLLAECAAVSEALEDRALGRKGSGDETGIVIGRAAGAMYGYVDALLFDRTGSIEDIRAALRAFPHVFFLSSLARGGGVLYMCSGDGADMPREIDMLHDRGAHAQAVDVLREAEEAGDLGHVLGGKYASALNNVGLYEDAIGALMRYERRGDSLWHYRMGYSLYYLDREAEAAEHFQRSIDLGDDDEDTREFLESCLEIIAEMERGGDSP